MYRWGTIIDISYRHSSVGAQLVDAGFVTESREYAVGADSFNLRKPLRTLALGRFRLDFDDGAPFAPFPTAACYLIAEGRSLAVDFLA